jgi:hypothetical protein
MIMTLQEAINIVALAMSHMSNGTSEDREACQFLCQYARNSEAKIKELEELVDRLSVNAE